MATLQSKKKDDPRRVFSHNPQAALPDRTSTTPNAPWAPPQQHARSASAQISRHQLLSPLSPPAEVHRKAVATGSESSSSLRISSANSSPVNSRPPTGYSSHPPSPYRGSGAPATLPVPPTSLAHESGDDSPTTKSKRKSWFGGGAKLSKAGKDAKTEKPQAWIVGIQEDKSSYDLGPLLKGQELPELWNPNGNTFVYLFPRTSGHGPSFRVDSSIFSASSVLTQVAYGRTSSVAVAGMTTASLSQAQKRQSLMDLTGRPGSRGVSPAAFSRAPSGSNTELSDDLIDPLGLDKADLGPIHLTLPISLSADSSIVGPGISLTENDVDTLVAARNLFAFLIGQSIIGTSRYPSAFSIFMKVAEFLTRYGFSNLDSSTYGEAAHSSFNSYVDELRLSDVRASREKNIEGIVLGEKMRSVLLYNEAFVHGVGRWDDLLELNSPKFSLISNVTKVRMERAALDLESRKRNINHKLIDFEFVAMFAGIMNSKTADEAKAVRFSVWRDAFMSMRKFFMGYYRSKYGAWPPKASSKKNSLETSGLNRLVLKDLYEDLSDLYDLLVNRYSLTTRTTDTILDDDDTEDAEGPMTRALRKVLNEYDRSTPPVQPPMPFDTPIPPTIAVTGDRKTDMKHRMKKLKKEALYQVLRDSYNTLEVKKDNSGKDLPPSPFIAAFMEFEYSQAAHCTIGKIADLRQGHWLFLYAVLQSLPMLIVDAPAVRWTQGVEYFLCMPPRSGVPWANNAETERTFYTIAGSNSAIVSLPSDIIEFGVEGIYRRSHCWIQAGKWTSHSTFMSAAAAETLKDLPAPPSFSNASLGGARSRSSSPMGSREPGKRRSVMMGGLEALPMPPGVFADPMNPGVRTPSASGSPVLGPRGSPVMRPQPSQADASKTFDAILGSVEAGKPKGKKK